jgi:hypothetical protein
MSKDKDGTAQPKNTNAGGPDSVSTNTPIGNPLMPPDKVTLYWLVHHVPLTLWFWLIGIIIGTFTVGVTVGQTTFVKELLGKKIETSQSQDSASRETNDSPKDSFTKKDGLEPKMSEPTPMQIYEEINKVPPLQGKDVARHYEGIKVDWELIFSSASQKENGFVLVLFEISPNRPGPINVGCAVKLSDYKELSIIRPGKKVRVTGAISHIEPGLFIQLKDVQLTYIN